MTTEDVNLALLWIGYPPSVAFVLGYATLLPWWRSWLGRALLASSTGLSALLGVNLGYRMWAWEILARDGWLRVAVYGFIVIGVWLMLLAFTVTVLRARDYRQERT